MDLGRVGLWTSKLDVAPAARAREVVAELDEQGWGAVWVPESRGKEAMSHVTLLLSASARIVVATGIASIWARDAVAAAQAHRTISEAFPGRFVLGLGVSHRPAVEGVRGHRYEQPLDRMREYLDGMDATPSRAPAPAEPPTRVLAALGPRMLALAAERAAGAHPYFVPVEHTVVARRALGAGPLLCPEQAVVLAADAEEGRRVAREHMAGYLRLPNYSNNLRRLGYGDDDLADGGSDRLVDAIVAWGGVEAAAARVRDHLDAGADHVCVQVLTADAAAMPLTEWRELAPALLG